MRDHERIRNLDVRNLNVVDTMTLNGQPWPATSASTPVAPAVTSVAGRTGDVVITTADVGGLGTIATRAATDFLAPTGDGSGLTNLNAAALASGVVATARLGSGAASASTYLRGDGTWSPPPQPAAPVQSVAGKTGAVTLAVGDVAGLAAVATSGKFSDLAGTPTVPAVVGGKVSITGTGTVTPAGLTTIASVVVSLGQDPSLAVARATATWSGTTVTIKVWRPTSALDGTPVLATTAAVVNWVALGS